MLKPILYERFLKCINRLNSRTVRNFRDEEVNRRAHFFIQYEMKGKIVKIEYNDVIYIEAQKNYITVHTHSSQFITYLTMKEIEENLPSTLFIRIHKSYIINLDKVVSVDGNSLQLKEKKELVIGSSYKDNFLSILKQKMIKTKR